MDFEELLKFLGLAATDEKAVKLKSLIDAAAAKQEKKIKTLTDKNAKLEESIKASGELKDKFDALVDRLEIDGEAEDFDAAVEAALENLSKSKDTPDEDVVQLKKELNKLKRDHAKEVAAKEELSGNLNDIKAKYQNGLVARALQAELVKGNAISPDMMVKLLKDQVKVGDDDSLIYINDNGDELEVAEGVAEFLKGHTEFVKSNGKPGAGTNLGADGNLGNNNVPEVVQNIIKGKTDTTSADTILSKYFPGSN